MGGGRVLLPAAAGDLGEAWGSSLVLALLQVMAHVRMSWSVLLSVSVLHVSVAAGSQLFTGSGAGVNKRFRSCSHQLLCIDNAV